MRVAVTGVLCLINLPDAYAANPHESGDVRRAAISTMQPRCAGRGDEAIAETVNFRIFGLRRYEHVIWCARRLEALRARLQRSWLGNSVRPAWSPKCDVVVHGTCDAYLRYAGIDAKGTLGASRIEFEGGRVATRRIDVHADQPGWFDAVVPHELSHVVLADEFPDGTLPAWADEGMAVMADLPGKQSLHLRDFNAGQRIGSAFRLVSLVAASGYPSPEKIPIFYGQSVSLVKYLVERRSPADFVRFLHLAEKAGYDAALAEMYGIGGLRSLERDWLASSSTLQRSSLLMAATAQDRDLANVNALVLATTMP